MSGDEKKKGVKERRKGAYDLWIETEGVPVIRDYAVADLKAVPVSPWERKGVPGTFIKLHGSEHLTDAYVLELPPGAGTKTQKHMFEELFYVLQGRGATSIWNGRGDRQSFEWQTGSVFSIPLNSYHEFHNGTASESVRLLAVTDAPLFINLLHNLDFVFNCPYDFTDRFAGAPGHFNGQGHSLPGRIWETNFVADVVTMPLLERKDRGAGGKNLMLELGNSSMGAHISEFPVGTYKKAHRHGPGSHVIILTGEGYSLIWKDIEDIHRIDWQPGSMLVPPDNWFHQHFNPGKEPARYLALRANSLTYPGIRTTEHVQAEYEDQDRRIHQLFVEECHRRGVQVRMDEFAVDAGPD